MLSPFNKIEFVIDHFKTIEKSIVQTVTCAFGGRKGRKGRKDKNEEVNLENRKKRSELAA